MGIPPSWRHFELGFGFSQGATVNMHKKKKREAVSATEFSEEDNQQEEKEIKVAG